jgi:hypothetical protein
MPDEPDATHETTHKEEPAPPRLRGESPEHSQAKQDKSENGSDVAGVIIWGKRFFRWWNRNRTLNFLTFVIACTTIVYSFFSYQQWQTMQRQLELSERPWLGIRGMNWASPPTFVAEKNFSLLFAYKNTGNTPALFFRANTERSVIPEIYPTVKMLFPENNVCMKLDEDKRMNVGVGVTVLPEESNTLTDDYQSLDRLTVAAIKNGTKALVIMGCFVYEDPSKKVRYTKFCEFTMPQAQAVNGLTFLFCPSGQYAD